jgi:hypothetical protein
VTQPGEAVRRIGDDKAGFTVRFDEFLGAIRVDAWGFWDAAVASAFGKAVLEVSRRSRGIQRCVFNMTELKPMREEGQLSWGMLVTELPAAGVTDSTVATASQLTKMQLLRIAKQSSSPLSIKWIDNVDGLNPSLERQTNGKR